MLRCNRCQVDYTGRLAHCPLCGGDLHGTPSPAVFPHQLITKPWRIALKLVELFSGAGIIALAILWGTHVLPSNIALLSIIAVGLNFGFVYNMLRLNPGFIRSSSRYILILIAAGFLLYAFTGLGWVVDFAIPIICLIALGFDMVMCCMLRTSFIENFAKYLIFDIVCGMLPLVCLWAGWSTFRPLAWVSAGCGALFLLVLLIFFREAFFSEFRKLSSHS